MIRNGIFALAMASAATLSAAEVEQVIVRQQWPWSTAVKVEYRLSGVTAPVDIDVAAEIDGMPVAAASLDAAVSGARHGLSSGGAYSFTIDPVAAFGSESLDIGRLRVQLSTRAAEPSITNALYRVFDLASGEMEELSKADIMNGGYGTYETNFAFVGTTSLSDVFIWTGVTNDVKYMTTHLVLRRIPAAGQTFMLGADSNTDHVVAYSYPRYQVRMTNDYWMGVFELTQSQYKRLMNGAAPSYFNNPAYADTRPVEQVSFQMLRGASLGKAWGDGVPLATARQVDSGSLIANLRAVASNAYVFDLPTETQWEIACRAGTETTFYDGSNFPSSGYSSMFLASLNPLARYNWNGGLADKRDTTAPNPPAADCDVSRGTARVGSYLPNAYGLYDMLGNVNEWCLDVYGNDPSSQDVQVEPMGAALPGDDGRRVARSGSWNANAGNVRASARNKVAVTTYTSGYGARICISAE